MDGPEHRDIVTLHGNGLISSRHFMASRQTFGHPKASTHTR